MRCLSPFLVCVLAAQSTPEALLRKGAELRDAGDAIGALKQFRAALELDPKTAAAHREAGLILLERRDFPAAAEFFRRASLLDPGDLTSLYNHALALGNGGKRQEALVELERLAAREPAYALARFGLGHVRAELGQWDEAERDFRKALDLDATMYRARFELGRLLERKGSHNEAIAAYRAAVGQKSDLNAARYRLAALLRQENDEAGASEQLRLVRETLSRRAKGERAGAAYSRGLGLLDQGQTEAGVKELERANELRPDFEEITLALAQAYERWAVEAEQQNRVNDAVHRFRESLRREPKAETENHVGVLLAKSGRIEEAVAHFRAALALRPGYASAQQNLDRALALTGKR